MRLSKLLWIIALCVPAWAEGGLAGGALINSAWAQGTKDPSYLGPTMSFPIRPRDEPAGTTATPNTSHTVPQRTIRLQRAYPYRIYRSHR
jgi:hypothetical protein